MLAILGADPHGRPLADNHVQQAECKSVTNMFTARFQISALVVLPVGVRAQQLGITGVVEACLCARGVRSDVLLVVTGGRRAVRRCEPPAPAVRTVAWAKTP